MGGHCKWCPGIMNESCNRFRRRSRSARIHHIFLSATPQEHDDGEAFRTECLRGVKRRLRLDEDVHNLLVAKTSGGVQSAAAMHERILGMGKTNSQRLHSNDQAAMLAQMWRKFKGASSITICCDASRLGRPAEETMMYVASARLVGQKGDEHIAYWLPPQAMVCDGDALRESPRFEPAAEVGKQPNKFRPRFKASLGRGVGGGFAAWGQSSSLRTI